MSREKMLEARSLIKAKQYQEARTILKTVDHPTARQWLAKLDEIEMSQKLAALRQEYANEIILYQQQEAQRLAILERQRNYQDFTAKSYTTAAVITLVLYFLLWIPGVIANLMYLNEAEEAEKAAGQKLPGVEALRTLKAVFVDLGLALLVIGVIIYLVGWAVTAINAL